MFKQHSLTQKENLSHLRWTLDEPRDWALIQKIIKALYPNDPAYSMKDVVNLLNDRPQWQKINSDIMRNEGYLHSLKKDRKVKG